MSSSGSSTRGKPKIQLRLNKGLPLKLPEFGKIMGKTAQVDHHPTKSGQQLPPLDKERQLDTLEKNSLSGKDKDSLKESLSQQSKDQTNVIIGEYQLKFEALKRQNE
jgi:hypothetical protein